LVIPAGGRRPLARVCAFENNGQQIGGRVNGPRRRSPRGITMAIATVLVLFTMFAAMVWALIDA
jgi:hypothetical protein